MGGECQKMGVERGVGLCGKGEKKKNEKEEGQRGVT